MAYPTGANTQVRQKPERGYAEMELITNDAEGTDPEIMQSLDELAREGARRMIVVALELEVDEYVSKLRQLRDEDGHALVVRNGHAQERTVTLGAGPVKVSAPRVNDRRDKQRFSSRILPPFTLVALAHDSVLRDATFAAAAPSRVPRERGRGRRGAASAAQPRRLDVVLAWPLDWRLCRSLAGAAGTGCGWSVADDNNAIDAGMAG